MRRPEPSRRGLLGVLVVVVAVALAGGIVGGYAKVFTPVVDVSVRADRSGLLMDPGAAVAMRGVTVGEVRAIRPDADGEHAVLEVALEPRQAAHIPADAVADIVVPTLLGPKYVELRAPARAGPGRIGEGARIPTASVSTEVNSVLANLNALLGTVDAAKLNSALGALSTSLQGRGERDGQTLAQLNGYLRALNPSLPTLDRDLATGADVAGIYADLSPDLVRVADNLAVTSTTLTVTRAAIPPLLSVTTRTAADGRTLLADNGGALREALGTLRPTAALLARYSPMFPCLLASSNQLRIDLEKVMGGQYPGLHSFTSLLPAQQGYRYPRDLPKVAARTGPSCFGGPLAPADAPFPHVRFDDGWTGFVPSDQVTVAPGSPLPNPLPRPLRGGAPR
ncbi:MAG TPA: MCE family protein [Pseudonocardia sp.]|jgi:phospholipid/cholesterol/gamma-HCH transport system substrate-binding protein